ncbi:MAG: hypothetical protein IKJ94_06890 [Oscillospiraceae bacterium]|nr:hypothetical protein [Oscillospiraceae bacterium]
MLDLFARKNQKESLDKFRQIPQKQEKNKHFDEKRLFRNSAGVDGFREMV